MTGVAETRVIPFKKVLKEYPMSLVKDFPISTSQKMTSIPEIKNLSAKTSNELPDEDIPMDQWIMPPQPERYIRHNDYDFL